MRPALVILTLAWQLLWLLVLVPGHVRGQVVVPGSDAADVVVDDPCCSAPADGEPMPLERRRDCYVCHVLLRMDVATPFVLPTFEPALLDPLPEPAAIVGTDAETLRDLRARGPPTRV